MIFYGIYTVFLLSKRAWVHVTPTVISDITHILHLIVNIIENRKGKILQTYTKAMHIAILKETGKKQP